MGNEISNEIINKSCEYRHIHKLNGKPLLLLRLAREELKCQQKQLEILGTSIIFPNQIVAAQKILNIFTDKRKFMVLGLGLTQSGKTGVMCSCIQLFANCEENPVPVNNIFIITGLSSREWIKQTRERMPRILHDNIYHRDNLKNLKEAIKGKKNILILIDEVQIACGIKQTISKEFDKANLLDKKYLLENDVKIIEFSATPNGNLYDYKKLGKHATKMRIFPGDNYIGCIDLLKLRRIKQCYPLSGKYYNSEILSIIDSEIQKFKDKRFLIFRTKTGDNQEIEINILKEYFGTEKFIYKCYDMENLSEEINVYNEFNESYESKSEIDVLLSKEPLKHTFIFLKEKARCAKTFTKKHVGIWYERFTNKFGDDIVNQGLLGRATGYDDNGDSIIFTNMDSVRKFKKMWNSNFEQTNDWVSNSTKTKRGITVSKGTFNSLINKDTVNTSESEIITKEFPGENGFEEANNFNESRNILNQFETRICNKKNFYETSIRGNTKVFHYEEIIKEKNFGQGDKGGGKKGRLYPCYKDITNKDSLTWVLCYPKK